MVHYVRTFIQPLPKIQKLLIYSLKVETLLNKSLCLFFVNFERCYHIIPNQKMKCDPFIKNIKIQNQKTKTIFLEWSARRPKKNNIYKYI